MTSSAELLRLSRMPPDQLRAWITANPEHAQRLVKRAPLLRATLARQSVNEFIELVGRDEETGRPLHQAPLHREMQRLANLHPRLLLWSHPEGGKAVPLDALVPTPRGPVAMGDISVGDEVFAGDGTVTRVSWCSPVQHGRTVYEVEFEDGVVERADANHQWSVYSLDDVHAGRGPRTTTTAHMLLRGLTRSNGSDGSFKYTWRVPLCGPAQYPARTLPVHPYVLGAWLGDGTSANSSLTFHEDDRSVYDRCASLHPRGAGPIRVGKGHVRSATLGPGAGGLRAELRALGVLGSKHVPAEYLHASVEQRYELLRGLLDTDGSIDHRGRVEFCSVLPRLAHGVAELARSLGYRVTCRESEATLRGRVVGKRYRVCFLARGDAPLFHLPRKLSRQQAAQRAGHPTRATKAITRITLAPSVPVRCIQVEHPSATYVLGAGYTVTHNTNQLSILRPLWRLGQNPNRRVVIVSETQMLARKIVRAQQGYLQDPDSDLRLVFPGLLPGAKWTETAYDVARLDGSRKLAKDYSVQAIGVGSGVMGTRIDDLILDDVLTHDNTRSDHARAEFDNWFTKTIMSRLSGDGRVAFIGNAWHPMDKMHTLAQLPGWHWRKFPALSAAGEPTWPAKWPLARIEDRRNTTPPAEFAREMLCEARSDEDARFKEDWIKRCLRRGDGIPITPELGHLPSGYRTYTGVDLGTREHAGADLTVFFTIILHPNGDREVLEVMSGRWTAPDIMARIYDVHRRYKSIIAVEGNAAQDFLRQLVTKESAIPVLPFTTDKKKHDPLFGVETLAVEMFNGKWIIPSHGGVPASKEMALWITEMLHYQPDQHTGDRLMASWIAKQAAAGLIGVRRKGHTGTLRI